MLHQLSVVLAAMTADLEAETVSLATRGWDAASGDVQQWTAPGSLQSRLAAVVDFRYLLWEFWLAQGRTTAAAAAVLVPHGRML